MMCDIYSTEGHSFHQEYLKSGPIELAKMINCVDFLLSRTESVFMRIFGKTNVSYTL